MGAIGKVFEVNDSTIAKSLGNMIISGVDNYGRNLALNDLLKTGMMNNRTVIVMQDSVTRDQRTQILATVSPYTGGKTVYELGLSSPATLDVLSAFHSAEEKANYIVFLFEMLSEITDVLKSKIHRFFFYLIDSLDNLSKPYTLSDLMKVDIEYVIDLVNASSLDDFEKNRRLRFLGDASTYSIFLDIESYMTQLESSGICTIYSGGVSMQKMFSSGNFVLISGYASEEMKKREALFNSISYALNSCTEKLCSACPMSLFIKNADFIKENVSKSLCDYNGSSDFATYFVLDDVARYIEKNGNEILDRINSFLIFTQGSGTNADFWSSFFGSHDFQEKSYSYTKKKSILPFGNMWDSGGVISSPRKYSSTTASFQTVNKPIYRPEIFREMKNDDVMCYRREPFMRRKCKIGG